MGQSKRIWIENDPDYEHVRRERQEKISTFLEPYTEGLGWRRFCTIDGKKNALIQVGVWLWGRLWKSLI